MNELSIYLLGAPRLEVNSQPVEPDTRKAIALLAYLAITGTRHTRDKLATLLWPEYDQSRSKAALRRTLSALKSTIGGHNLDIQRESLGLEIGAKIWIDVYKFRLLLDECRDHGHLADESCPLCLIPLTEAIALYHGDFLAGFSLRDSLSFDEWQYYEEEKLRRELASALRNLVQCQQTQGLYNEAIPKALRFLELDLLSEQAHRLLMTLYTLGGQRAAALRQYRNCVRILDEELGVAPLEETTALYEQILRGDLSAETKRRSKPEPTVIEKRKPRSPLPLVGRAAEWAALLESYRSVKSGGRLVVLEGEAGIGKTRLAQVFLETVSPEGSVTIASQCFEGEATLAFTPFAEGVTAAIRSLDNHEWLKSFPRLWLIEAARLVPDLAFLEPDLPTPLALDNPGAQNRFFEATCQLLLALGDNTHPGILFIDDLQWSDEASQELLAYIVQRLHNYPLFVLVTWRSEQLPKIHRLRQMLTTAQRKDNARLINLDRLDQSAVNELVQAATGNKDVENPLAHRLFLETEGLPYFLVEYLAMLDLSAVDANTPSISGLPMPGGVRDLLRSRLAPVNETGRQLLHTAAVIGRTFDFDTLREASGRGEEETIFSLEELIALRLIVERPGEGTPGDLTLERRPMSLVSTPLPAYDFSHEKLRALVYEETSLARRRLLHRRVAQVLVGEQGLQSGSSHGWFVIGLAAYHFQQAGLENASAEYYKQAGDQAQALYANIEALAHYQSALALGYADSLYLHEAIGDLYTLRGEYQDALASYESAAATLDVTGQPGTLARLESKLGGVYHRRGDWDLAAGHYQQAINRSEDDGQQARILTDWCLTAHHGGDDGQAQSLAEEAITLAQAAGDRRALAQAHNMLGILANSRGGAALAGRHLEQSLALAEDLPDPTVKIAALNNLSLARRTAGELDLAIQLVEEALALCLEVGDRHREAALHNNLADLLHATDQADEAMDHLKQAVTIYADIGGGKSDWQPEIWKLTEW